MAMDQTLAQLFNHIIETELEMVKKDRRIALLEAELMKVGQDIPASMDQNLELTE